VALRRSARRLAEQNSRLVEELVKLFSTLFNIATLPVTVALDTVCVLADASMDKKIFERTKEKCADIDSDLE
jgi:hypothetical protein